MAAFKMALGGCCCGTIYFDWYWGFIDMNDTDPKVIDYIPMTSAVIPTGKAPEEWNSVADDIDNYNWKIDVDPAHDEFDGGVQLTLVRFGQTSEKVGYYRKLESSGDNVVGFFNGTTELPIWEDTISTASTWPAASGDYLPPTITEVVDGGTHYSPRHGDLVDAVIGYIESNPTTPHSTAFTSGGTPSALTQEGHLIQQRVSVPFGISGDDDRLYYWSLGGLDNTPDYRMDAIVGCYDGGYELIVGTASRQDWENIEYPNPPVDDGTECEELADQIENLNGGRTISRIVIIPPRCGKRAFAVKYPRTVYYPNDVFCGGGDGYTEEVMEEDIAIYYGSIQAPGVQTDPIEGPDAGTTVVWADTVSGNILYGPHANTSPRLEFTGPHRRHCKVLWGDANELDDWACIFATMEREWAVDASDQNNPYSEITSEVVTLHIRMGAAGANGSGSLRSWQCYDDAQLERADSLTAIPPIDPSLNMGEARYFAWCERVFDEEPAGPSVGYDRHKLVLWQVGDSGPTWEYTSDDQSVFIPRIVTASDRFMYVWDFSHTWTEEEGATGGAINTQFWNWLFSYEWDEVNNRPKTMYPFRDLVGQNYFHYRIDWDEAPFVDSPKISRQNRISPPARLIRSPSDGT